MTEIISAAPASASGGTRSILSRLLGKITRAIPPRLRKPVLGRSVHRLEPVSRKFGADRGMPICRHYIHKFLRDNAGDIHGNTLEIGDATYTRMFGGERVTQSDVLHVLPGSPGATIIADLSASDSIESSRFDCVIVTQTLNVIYDVEGAVRTIHRILKPGGVVLATLPGISQISRYDMDRWGEYWRFTTASAQRLFGVFGTEGEAKVRSYGNVAAAVAYLQGLAVEDVGEARLDRNDPDYQLLITVRAVKKMYSEREPPRDAVAVFRSPNP